MLHIKAHLYDTICRIGRLQLRHKNRDPTPYWLISETKMVSALRPIDFSAHYEKLDAPEKERYKKSMDVWV